MSMTIDQYAVEMRFDNQHFEKNVSTSLSTLDKLKQSLNLTSSAKGLENLGNAAKNVDMRGLGGAVETVTAKFSALQVMGVTALANITNSAVNAGKRIVKSLTIDPVSTGFSEYELKMGSIQTIMASTGESLEVVNGYLNKLNEYSDKTIYSFSDMTQNIGKFTNAGVKLKDAVAAIQGISNVAAVSGANANEASRAMYNFAQALSAGYVKLIDWKSIENANMATVEFKNQLLEAAVAAGTLQKTSDGMYKVLTENNMGSTMDQTISATKNFNDSLNYQWMTTDVLVKTLNDYADETTVIGKKATQAATEVKTFSQMMDSLKESAQSGWAQTWEIVFGDFHQGKSLWTGIYGFVGGIIDKMSKFRNDLLKSAFGKSFTKLGEIVTGALEPAEKAIDTVKNAKTAISDLGKVVDDVIGGKFGNGQDRIDKLTKAGHNFYEVQNKVNEALGNSKRYTKEQIDAQNKLLGTQKKSTETTSKKTEETKKLTKEQKNELKNLAKMVETGEANNKLNKEQIDAFKELAKVSKKTGIPIEDLIDNLDKLNGRWLLLESFKNIGKSIGQVFEAIGEAWRNTFRAINGNDIFNAIASFYKFTSSLSMSEATVQKLTSTFKGLFAILDLVTTIFGGGVKLAFTIANGVLRSLGLTILDVTAWLGEAIWKFNNFLETNKVITAVFDGIAAVIVAAIDKIKEFAAAISENPIFQTISDLITGMFGDGTEEEKASKVSGAISGISSALSDLNSGDKVSVFQRINDGFSSLRTILNSKWTASLTSGLRILDAVLGLFDTDLSQVIAKVADFITKIAEWIKNNTPLIETNRKIAEVIYTVATKVIELAKAFLELDVVKEKLLVISTAFIKIKDTLSDLGSKLSTVFGKFLEVIGQLVYKLNDGDITTDQFGKAIVDGIITGIKGAASAAKEAILGIGQILIDAFCELLRINSPSLVFAALGGFIIAGLINGLKNGKPLLGSIFDGLIGNIKGLYDGAVSKIKEFYANISPVVTTFIEEAKKMIAKIDFGSVFAVMIGLTTMSMFKSIVQGVDKLGDALGILAGPIKALTGAIGGVKTAIETFNINLTNLSTAFSKKVKAEAFKSLAISLLILTGAIAILVYLVDKDGWAVIKAVGLIILLAGVMVALAKVLEKVQLTDVVSFAGFGLAVMGIAFAVLILAGALKVMESVDPTKLAQTFAGLGAAVISLMVILALIAKLADKLSAKEIGKLGGIMLGLSAALILMALAAKIIGGMGDDEMDKAAKAIAGFIVIVAAVAAISTLPVKAIGKTMRQFSVSLLLLVAAAKIIAGMTWGEMGKAAVGLLGLVGVIAILALITTIPGKKLSKVGGTLMALSGSLVFLAIAVKLLGDMEWSKMGKAAVGLLGLVGVVTLLVAITKIAGDNAPKIALTLLAMSVSIGILAAVAMMLSLLKLENLVKGIAAVSMLIVMVGLFTFLSKGAGDVKNTMIGLAIAIGTMAIAVAALTFLDPKKLWSSVAALSVLMLAFAQITKGVKTVDIKGIVALGIMVVAIGVLAQIIRQLSTLENPNAALVTAGALSLVLMAMGTAMNILNKKTMADAKTLIGLAAMTAVVAALAGILGVMDHLNVEASITSAVALGVLLNAMSAACLILSNITKVSNNALNAMGWLTIVVASLAVILGVMDALNVEASIPTATALSILLLGMSGACAILSYIGPMASAGLAGIGLLGALVAGMAIILTALGGLNELTNGAAGEFIKSGIPLLEDLGLGLGKFVGAIIGGLGEGITAGLPGIAENLNEFMTTLNSGFVAGAKQITPEVLSGVTTLVDMILMITGAGFLERIASFGLGTSSMERFASDLTSFGNAIVAFSDTVKGRVDETAVTAAASAGSVMAELQNKVAPCLGLVQAFSGQKNLAIFGQQLVSFGFAIVGFSTTVSTGGINEEAVTAAAAAGSVMAELQSKVAPSMGIVQLFTGQKNLAEFGNQLISFGYAITGFSQIVSQNGINEEAVTAAAKAGDIMVALQEKIPNAGGVIGFFTGKQDLGTFATNIAQFGLAIAGFSNNVSSVDEGAVTAAANAGSVLAKLQKNLPEDKWFDGKMNLGEFGKEVESFGSHMSAFSYNLSGFDADSANNAISSMTKFKNFINSLNGMDTSGVKSFKSAIGTLGNIDFSNVFKSSSNMTSVGSDLISTLTKGMTSKQGSLRSAASSTVNVISKAFSSEKDTFKTTGVDFISKLTAGMSSKSGTVKSTLSKMISTMVTTTRGYYDNFHSAGSYLVTGFANGISANTYKAKAKAKAMAEAAVKAAKAALDINSPSKVFRAIGSGVPEGFAQGIGMLGSAIKGSVEGMASTAIKGTKAAMARVADAVNADIDAQPTIRPVLDLSDVTAGANRINGMFGMNPSVGLMSRVNGVSAMMNGYNQNGNLDVISAINKLGKSLANSSGGNTYIVDGVTYDDGSNVTNAVKDIIRYTRIEGRA